MLLRVIFFFKEFSHYINRKIHILTKHMIFVIKKKQFTMLIDLLILFTIGVFYHLVHSAVNNTYRTLIFCRSLIYIQVLSFIEIFFANFLSVNSDIFRNIIRIEMSTFSYSFICFIFKRRSSSMDG